MRGAAGAVTETNNQNKERTDEEGQRSEVKGLEKTHQWCVVLSRIGNLTEELRILRQSKGITAGEKKAIGAMLAKLGKFDEYGLHGCTKEGGAK